MTTSPLSEAKGCAAADPAGAPEATPRPAPGEPQADMNVAPPAPLDSPGRTVLGLAVLWGCLMLIFAANRWSESYIHVDLSRTRSAGQDQMLLALEPQAQLPLPLTVHLRGASPRQAVARIARNLQFQVADDALALLNDEPRNIQYDETPLYRVLHGLLSRPDQLALGYAFHNRRLLIFEQQLTHSGKAGQPRELEWTAVLPLSRDPLLVVPSGSVGLWFTLELVGSVNEPESQWRTVQVAVWKGSERLLEQQVQLDPAGAAQLDATAAKARVRLSLKRLGRASAGVPEQSQIRFDYQAAD